MQKRGIIALFTAFIVLSLVSFNFTYADSDGFNMTDLPNQLALSLDTSIFISELLLSSGLLLLSSSIVGFCVRKSSAAVPIIALCDFLVLGFCVGLGWLPAWTFVMCILIVSLLVALKWKDVL